MTNNNRIIRVFVSSTFSDMNKERDYLMTKVFPHLKEIARRRNVTLVELDLRWGIKEEDTRNGKVLQSCLDAIRDSKPFFIGIIGNRVGWCPTIEEIRKNPILIERYPDIVKDIESGYSVTEIEMQYAVLRNPEKMHAYFYFRKHIEPLDDRINLLRDKVLKSGYPVAEYTEESEFGNMVETHFIQLLDELYPESSISNTLYTRESQIERIEQISLGYIDYNHVEDLAIDELVCSNTYQYLSIVGDTGMGKSSLLAHWVLKNSNNRNIIPCFIGCSHLGSSLSVIKDFLRKEINTTIGLPESSNNTLENALLQIPSTNLITFVIDGIDNLQLTPEEMYVFLASFSRYSKSCKVLFSLTPDSPITNQLHRLNARYYNLKSLTEDRLCDLGTQYLKRYEKSLEEDKLFRIAKSEICSNPLIFKSILNELITIATHENIDAQISKYIEAKSAEDLYDTILVRYEKTYGYKLTSTTLSLLVNSPMGLSEIELYEMLNPNAIEWAQLYYAVSPFFTIINGCLFIENEYLLNAVRRRYQDIQYLAQSQLISYFEKLLSKEISHISDGVEVWKSRAADILKIMLYTDAAALENYSNNCANHDDLLNGINRIVSILAELLFVTHDFKKLSYLITSPLCYLSLEIHNNIRLRQYLQSIKQEYGVIDLSTLLDVNKYPLRLADLVYPDICLRIGKHIEEIVHDSKMAIKAYKSAIKSWDERGFSATSDLYVLTTCTRLMSLYASTHQYEEMDSLYKTITERFFDKKGWAPEYKTMIVTNYIASLKERGRFQDAEKAYDLAFILISEIGDEEMRKFIQAQTLASKGNYYAERVMFGDMPLEEKNRLSNIANQSICESLDIYSELVKLNPYKYKTHYIQTRHDLACLHQDMGNKKMALSIYKSILADDSVNLDIFDVNEEFYTEDEVILHTIYSLAALYDDMGNYEDAEKLIEVIFKIRESQYNEDSKLFADKMAICAYEKARLYSRMGKNIQTIEKLYNKSIECYTFINENSLEIVKCYSSLGLAFQRVQMYREAVHYYMKARQVYSLITDNSIEEARIAEILFQEAQCALFCNEREHFRDCMIQSFDMYEKLSQVNPIYARDLERVANYMDELLKVNGLK